MAEYTLQIDGMHCGSCVKRVGQALASVEGLTVKEIRVGAARFVTSREPAPVEAALEALARIGFGARLEG
jgi:copper chaperone CopZ